MSSVKVYGKEQIQTMEWYEHVQNRIGMYIPDKYEIGINHLFKEIIQNSLDECNEGFGQKIVMQLDDETFTCRDYGRGIPFEKIVDVFTKMNTSGKFDANSYSTGVVGLNGVGNKVVNALSSKTIAEVYKNGIKARVEFSYGQVVKEEYNIPTGELDGTYIEFKPDKALMQAKKLDIDLLKASLKNMSLLFKDIYFMINGDVFKSNGLIDFINEEAPTPLFKPISISETLDGVIVEIFLTYIKDIEVQTIRSFANNVETYDDGTHVVGLKLGLGITLKKLVEEAKIKISNSVNTDDFRSGLVSVVSIKMDNNKVHFVGQGKTKLGNTEVQGIVQRVINNNLPKVLNATAIKAIASNADLSAKARASFQKTKEGKIGKKENKLSVMSNLDKFKECTDSKAKNKELFLVEGGSALGSAIPVKLSFQALYALKGKPLNTNGMESPDIIKNEELATLIFALTNSRGSLKAKYDSKSLRYDKVIIMADADDDGLHIEATMIDFFAENTTLIEDGKLYLAVPPLYKIIEKGKTIFIKDEEEYQTLILDRLQKECNIDIKIIKQLFTYKKNIDALANAYKVNYNLLEAIIFNTLNSHEEIAKSLETTLGVKSRIENNDYLIDGLVVDNFINTRIPSKDIETIIEETSDVQQLIINNPNIISGSVYEYINTKVEKVSFKHRTRLKGLGEMNAKDLFESTMNPDTRMLIQVTMRGTKEESQEVLNTFFDKSKVQERRKLLLESRDDE